MYNISSIKFSSTIYSSYYVNPFSPAEQTVFANNVDPDETAHNEPSHQDLHCLPFCFDFDWDPYLEQWFGSDSKMGESTSETRGWKG